jgi:hypothetical protein
MAVISHDVGAAVWHGCHSEQSGESAARSSITTRRAPASAPVSPKAPETAGCGRQKTRKSQSGTLLGTPEKGGRSPERFTTGASHDGASPSGDDGSAVQGRSRMTDSSSAATSSVPMGYTPSALARYARDRWHAAVRSESPTRIGEPIRLCRARASQQEQTCISSVPPG